jgi:hypothetical protein
MESIFLVFIPCSQDFDQAIAQAKTLRQSELSIKDSPLKLKIVISVNGFIPSKTQKENAEIYADLVMLYGIGLLADLNIANGFIFALSERPKYFWLLSTNDKLTPIALKEAFSTIENFPEVDLIVANSIGLNSSFVEKNIIDPSRPGFSYGVISGVIYRLERIFDYLHNGPFMAWTGWSHLAVMQSAMDGNAGLRVRTIPDFHLYSQREGELLAVGKKYGHSFFGMIILASVFKSNQRQVRKFIRQYVFKNFYNLHLYSRKWRYQGKLIDIDNYLAWNQNIAESMISRSSMSTYIFYVFAKQIPLANLNKITLLRKMKKLFDKLVGQSKVSRT